MSEPSAASSDQNTLLTTSVLKLASDLKVVQVRANRVALKLRSARTHLMITPEQWLVL